MDKEFINNPVVAYQKLINDYAKLQTENERLKHLREEINDFISDISTCGFKYDDRCPDNLDELQCCIEDLCNKFSNYKQILQEIKEIAETCISKDACFECKYSDDCNIEDAEIPSYDICKLLIQKLTKAEEE